MSILDGLHELVVKLAPELDADVPLHVIDANALGDWRGGDHIYGWARNDVPHALADTLGTRGRIIALDLANILADAIPGRFDMAVNAVALHEAAHLLPRPAAPPAYPNTVLARVAERLEFAADMRARLLPLGRDLSHDLRFARRAGHLACRAAAAGVAVHYRDILGSAYWGCSWTAYLDAIAPEAAAHAAATFAEIEAAPPPPALLAAWDADLEFQRATKGKPHVRRG